MMRGDRGRRCALPARLAPAFLQYLSEGGDHAVLLDVLRTHRTPHELEHIARAASEFLVEALAVFEMTQRGVTELLSTLGSDQHHAQDMKAELEQKEALERATGMLVERHGLSADTAAERIRQTAALQGIAVEEAASFLRQPSADGRRRVGR